MRRTTLASLVLHGAALLWVAGGLHANPPPPAQPVFEMAFLPSPPEEAPPVEHAEEIPEAASPEGTPAEAATPEAAAAEAPAQPEAAPEPAAEPPATQLAQAPSTPAPAPLPTPEPQRRIAAPRPAPRVATARPAVARAEPASGPPAPEPPAPAAPTRAQAAPPPGYVMALFAALERRKEYPEAARWRRAEGVALLRVSLRRDGSVIAWRVERSSGHADLDASLERMVLRASPLPAPPPEIPGEPVEFTVPVRFSLR